MWLPTRGQVDAVSRHAITAAGTMVLLFGLQAKGVDIDVIKGAISALGETVNTIVVLLGALAPVYALLRASHNASPIEQAKAVEATGAVVVTTTEIAKATPDSPNIVSKEDVKVVSR